MGEPSAEALDWAASAVGAAVTGTTPLRADGVPWMVDFADGSRAVLRRSFASDTEIAALRVAADHGIRAPRLIALGDDLMLVSAIEGTSRVPVTASESRLRALGAAAAQLHAVELAPSKDLPVRHQSVELWDFTKLRRQDGASDLLLAAEKAVASRQEPPSTQVFLHGDLWQGNTMWLDDELVAVIDWDCAGVGHPGIDLGSLRCDVAVMFGVEAADAVLDGWQEQAGRVADAMPYWDVIAGLSTPPDMTTWATTIQDQGRPDLDGATLTARRDELLRTALAQLLKTD
jgi:aminoglycoside phosphotransferase (APT) family kinase protein